MKSKENGKLKSWFARVVRFYLSLKVSIRFSILTIVLFLTLSTSFLIVGVVYFTMDSMLVASAEKILAQSSKHISEQIKGQFGPLNIISSFIQEAMELNVLSPNDQNFGNFLRQLIYERTNMTTAYWCDSGGSYYLLTKEAIDTFVEETVTRDRKGNVVKASSKLVKTDGSVIADNTQLYSDSVDPRLRPWYLAAKENKVPTWTLYDFIKVGSHQAQLGVTIAFPVYDRQHNLVGVLGMDAESTEIVDFLKSISLTPNGFVLLIEGTGRIIAVHAPKLDLLADKNQQIDQADLETTKDGIKQSYDFYMEQQISPFIYFWKNERYLIAYERVTFLQGGTTMYVATGAPMRDIIAPLLENVLICSLLIILSLLIGFILASIFSSSISSPVKKLAKDASLIRSFRLSEVVYRPSRIREIAETINAFTNMKNVLYSFQRYMPVALLKKLLISGRIAEVGGERKELTMLFTDIQDFTSISEKFEAKKLMKWLSEYFQCITRIVLDNHGTLDKYIGDGLMAFWGAPLLDNDHTRHACIAAVESRKALEQLNNKWSLEEGKPTLITRFGIGMGKVIVGNVGSEDRLNYTVMGDAVNVASRLEGLNKVYASTIIVSDSVYNDTKGEFPYRLLDCVALKGRKQGIYIYELVDDEFMERIDLEKYNSEFAVAFYNYEKGCWKIALDLFDELTVKYPDDRLAKIFLSRCLSFIASPPLNWEGIWVIGSK